LHREHDIDTIRAGSLVIDVIGRTDRAADASAIFS
jgi:hypothetical protein